MGTAEVELLKATLKSNNHWAGICTIAVFVGLLVEYTILLWLKREELTGTEIALTILAGLAIAGGVFGEYHFGSAAADAAMKLETISENRVAELNVMAQNATALASRAQAALAGAERDAERFRAQIANATKRASEADEKAAQARLDLAKYKAWRILTPQQEESIRATLKSFSGSPYDLGVDPTPEAINLLVRIDNVVKSSGWNNKAPVGGVNILFSLKLPNGHRVDIAYTSGVIIELSSPTSKLRPAAEALVTALRSTGLNAKGQLDHTKSPNAIHIIVGTKQ